MKKILKLLVLASLTALILLTLASCDILFEDIPPVSIWGPEGNNPLECSHIAVVDEAIAPTCTKSGRTEGQHCSRCKKVLVAQEVIEALGHTEVVDAAVAPTCTKSGLTAGIHCSVCNKELLAQEKINALGHSIVIDAPVAPTCTKEGKSEGIHCSVCETVLVAQTPVKALGHNTYTVIAVQPTCTTEGVTAGEYCLDCGTVLAAPQTIPATGHTNVDVDAVAPTCTETGLTEGAYCSVCGETTKEQEVIPALGHTVVVDAAVAPTCTETGLTEGSHCSVCGEVFAAQEVVDALGHTEVKVKQKAATCTKPGNNEYSYCSVCNEEIIKKVMILPLGHNFVIDKAVAPTCTQTGLTEGKHCSRCSVGRVVQEIIPVIDHTPVVDAAVAATCTKTGLTEGSHCSVCGKVIVAQQPTPVIDHTPAVDAAVAPTCLETGLTEGSSCSVCKTVLVAQEIIPSFGSHSGSNIPAKAATCTEAGHTAYFKCSRCDYTVNYVEIPALGHNKVAHEAKAPNCTNVGNEAYETCTRCNYTTYVEIPALGHTEVVVPGKAATCDEDGLTDGKYCSVCEETLVEQEVIPAGHKGHEVDFKCDACGETILPEADSVLTIEQAINLGKLQASGKYTTDKYYVTGIITEVYNTTWGNMYITDGTNTFLVYGVVDANGKRYDAMTVKPNVGDTITVYSTVGNYNGNPQVKNAPITEHIVCEHVLVETEKVDATCTKDGFITKTCSICKVYTKTETIDSLGHTTDNGICDNCGEEITGAPAEPEVLATFDFGANGKASHVDGNDYGKAKSFTSNGYTLALTGMSKVYGPAYDAKGNSCIKLGTSKVVGTFSFTVSDDVNQVIIYVAKYKNYASKINVNGTAYTLTKNSNDGQYDVIVVDTSVNKTVTFTTVSGGVRAMINTIEFWS